MGTNRGKALFDIFRQFGVRAPSVCAWLAFFGALLCVFTGPGAAAQTDPKNVLVLYPYGEPPSFAILKSTMQARIPEQINFYTVSMSNRRFEEEDYQASLAKTFGRGYYGIKLDVVIASTYPVLQFAVRYRNEMFPGVPIVFFDVYPNELEGHKIWPGVTGVIVPLAMQETIDLALHLHPDTSSVAVITGTSQWERYWLELAHSELLRYQDKVREIDLIGPASPQMLEKVAALPPHTVVLFQLAPHDSNAGTFGFSEILTAAAQRLPTYSVYPGLGLAHGGIGGAYRDIPKDVRLTAETAVRVVSGERPENIPIVRDSSVQVQVDWRALQRWHIPESALPAGSVILYRPPSLWEQYRRDLTVAIVVIAVLAFLIVGLLWQRARRRKAETVLSESEERFRVMADSTPSLMWMCDPHGKITYLNERRMAFTGPDPKAGYGDSWIAYIHPDDVQNVLDALYKALKDHRPFSKEYRLRRSDGVYRPMFDVASPRVNGDGSFGGFIGSAIDVTDQKLAQQALENVSGQLIEAQERERSRIARDLHDDICQRLALLSMEIEQADHGQSGSPKKLEEIRKHCSEIAGDVQSLSHELHSSKLDYLGVVAAVRGFCSEFSKQHKVSIESTDSNVPGNLSKEISLCLFRVVQEALHNAAKHSGVSHFSVKISGRADEVRLEVRDAGAGFDVEEAKKNRGLGLVSMQERVHLVHGTFTVESQPGKGTIALAVVPFAVENGSPAEGDQEIAGVAGAL
jgi:PAS domain S-box-containing protein